MSLKEDALQVLTKLWTKLQDLPQAGPLELGAFILLILFFAMFLLLSVMCCLHCCCSERSKQKRGKIEPI